jgi:hypothetical protein
VFVLVDITVVMLGICFDYLPERRFTINRVVIPTEVIFAERSVVKIT